jgi:hypothetical protein
MFKKFASNKLNNRKWRAHVKYNNLWGGGGAELTTGNGECTK